MLILDQRLLLFISAKL